MVISTTGFTHQDNRCIDVADKRNMDVNDLFVELLQEIYWLQ